MLERGADTNHNVFLREVNVNRPGVHQIDIESPLSKQFHLVALPSFRIYDASGKMVIEGSPEDQKVVDLLKKLFNGPSKKQ